MIIDDGGIYSCNATDEIITQTFVYVDENQTYDKCKFKTGRLDNLKNHIRATHQSAQ